MIGTFRLELSKKMELLDLLLVTTQLLHYLIIQLKFLKMINPLLNNPGYMRLYNMSNPGINANIVSNISSSTLSTNKASIASTNAVNLLDAGSNNKIDWGNVFLVVGLSVVTIIIVAKIFDDHNDV
jgi:hypothetical protein